MVDGELATYAEIGFDIHPDHGPDAKMSRPIVILGNLLNPEIIRPMVAGGLRLDGGLRLSLSVRENRDGIAWIRILAGGLRLGRDDQRKSREAVDETPRKKIPEADVFHKTW